MSRRLPVVPYFDPRPLTTALQAELTAAVQRVVESGWYLLGPELEAFEAELARYVGVGHAVGVANGTDAIELALRALGVGPGDEVLAPAHTAVPTICAIERSGAVPVLADIDPATYGLCPQAAAAAVTVRTKAIVAVHLYGHPADLNALAEIAQRHHLALIEDAAQALGADLGGRRVGGWGAAAALSFYPTKNLGAMGDAGAVLTPDKAVADRVRQLRQYGQSRRGWSESPGANSRLDELQAAVLRIKLAHLDQHQAERRRLAGNYAASLAGAEGDLVLPAQRLGTTHAWHLHVVRHPRRDALARELQRQGIGTMIHYPYAVHQQPAYAHLTAGSPCLVESERAARQVLSLPLYVGMTDAQLAQVATAVARFTLAGDA